MTDETNGRQAPRYSVAKIEPAAPPEGGADGEWYRYCIANDSSEIVGMRAGSLSAVRDYVEQYVDQLNQRAKLGYSTYAPRKVSR